MNFDITSLLLGSAFAFLLALLAWGDQIRKPRKEIMQLEENFRKEYNLKKEVTNPLIRKSYDDMKTSKRYSFLQQTKAMIDILENPKFKGKNVKLLEQFRKLHEIRKKLEKEYSFRYLFSLWVCITLFILGAISVFTSDLFFYLFDTCININYVYLAIALIMAGVLIINFFITHKTEEKFMIEIYNIDDTLEVN